MKEIKSLKPKRYHICIYPDYKGNISHLFLFYDWNKVDEIEKGFADNIWNNALRKILKTQIFMCKRRIRTYSDLIEELNENPKLAEICELNSKCIPVEKYSAESWIE